MSKQIPLTKGKVARVDAIDYPFLAQYRWCYNSKGYAVHYWTDEIGGKHTASIHRWIMERMLGSPIPRRLTIGSDVARDLSFQPELCAILCATCHQQAEACDTLLWERNYQRHGKEQVVSAFDRLWAVWPVNVKLPEVNDDKED